MSDVVLSIPSKIKDIPISMVFDERGLGVSDVALFGELKCIIFRLPEQSRVSGVRVNLHIKGSDILLINETINSDVYYVLKVQPHDGFSQYWTHQSEYYLFNGEVLELVCEGVPLSDLMVTFRTVEV